MLRKIHPIRASFQSRPSFGRARRPLWHLAGTALILAACEPRSIKNQPAARSPAAELAASSNPASAALASDTLEKLDVRLGTGAEATSGRKIHLLYRGSLVDGKIFDARQERLAPFVFKLGDGTVIEGLDQGVRGMKVGGVRRLTVPPRLGYRERAVGQLIPPNSTLIFEIELLKVD